jgi:hypothetical protein
MPRHLSPIVLALCLALAGSPLAAAGHRTAGPLPRLVKVAAPAEMLGRFWGHLGAAWGAVGCGLDPDGAHCSAADTVIRHRRVAPQLAAACAAAADGCRADAH